MLKVMENGGGREVAELRSVLDEVAQLGALRMLIEVLRTEADDYVARHRGARDEHGRALVVRNGRARARKPAPSTPKSAYCRHGADGR